MRKRLITAASFGTVAVFSATDYFIHNGQGGLANTGALIGLVGVAGARIGYSALNAFREEAARASISFASQYLMGEKAEDVLFSERHHKLTVATKVELFKALKQTWPWLTPKQFLEDIYEGIPISLIDQRRTEIMQAQYPRLNPREAIGNSLPKLVEAAHDFQHREILRIWA